MISRRCSLHGFETPERPLLERERRKRDLATKTLTIDAPDRPDRASEKRPVEANFES